jgi:hypothetical protein
MFKAENTFKLYLSFILNCIFLISLLLAHTMPLFASFTSLIS